jgi:hypothetical protein
VADRLRDWQIAFDAYSVQQRQAGLESEAQGEGPLLFDPSALLDEYFPTFEREANAGDLRAISWCLQQLRWYSPLFRKVESSGEPQRWWSAFSSARPDDASIERALKWTDWAVLIEDPVPGCEALLACARSPQTRAIALGSLAHFYETGGKPVESSVALRRLAEEYPQTGEGARARATLQQRNMLRVGEPFPDLERRRFIDIARARATTAPNPETLLATAADTFSLAEYRGKVVALILWDYHCGFCLAELPFERELYARLAPHGFEIVGVYTDPNLTDYSKCARENPVPWRNAWDVPGKLRQGPLCRELGVTGVPFTVVLDRRGNIREVDARGEKLEAAIVRVLEER